MNRNVFIFTIVLFFCACKGQKQLSKIDYALLYHEHTCNPQLKIYHLNKDSSLFYFNFKNSDLLFKKSDSGAFEASISISYNLFTSYHQPEIIDSSTMVYHIIYDSLGTGYTGSTNFKALAGNDYILKINFTDMSRNQSYIYSIPVKKSGWQSAQFFNMIDLNEQPIIQTYIPKNTTVKILPPPSNTDSIAVRCYFRNFPLAPPPFSDIPLSSFKYTADYIYYLKISELNKISFPKEGFYHFQFDTLSKQGFTVFCFDDDFPVFTKSEQLLESLRYLCTREEYNSLLQKADKKKAIDDFWLAKAGNNERGRKLIRIYYNRSIEANKLFTSYLEGWKTDRGMLYIIFGPPKSVFRDMKYETWRYSVSEGIPDVQFVFSKVNNPFSENDYELERSINYQSVWYMAVDSWRSGRIVGEH